MFQVQQRFLKADNVGGFGKIWPRGYENHEAPKSRLSKMSDLDWIRGALRLGHEERVAIRSEERARERRLLRAISELSQKVAAISELNQQVSAAGRGVRTGVSLTA